MDIGEMFQFEECDNGYVLKNFLLKDDASVTELEIPSKYKGKPVISIGFEAFMNANHLCSVKIQGGIEGIGAKAFYSCENLKTVILPDSLTAILDNAFDSCTKLDDISFPNGLKVIGCEAFSKCNIKSAVLPSGLEELGLSAFFSCGLRSVILPKNIKTISSAFSGCRDLERIEFPDSLKEIEHHAFWGCGFRTLTFPSGLERIKFKAFAYCEKLEKVDFQKGSPVMEFLVFEHCHKLSAENILQGLACSTDITKPFLPSVDHFDWDSALREDVFALAMKYDSFALFDKKKVLVEITERGRVQLLPLVENAGGDIADIMKKHFEEFLDISMKKGFAEITAWLLDYKNRKMGFGEA